ncbi:hypothetical protein M0802_008917 [Mischocyttarus mexicanus]|nr:hypothetical protein M0802_008917 [Mischocyttarus mexicanus]
MKLTESLHFVPTLFFLIVILGGIPTIPSQEHATFLPADECDWIGRIFLSRLYGRYSIHTGRVFDATNNNNHGVYMKYCKTETRDAAEIHARKGLRGGGGRGVRPVYLRCSRGTVLWRYPRGALRIVLSVAAAISSSAFGSRSGIGSGILANGNKVHEIGPKSNSRSSSYRVCVKASGPARIYLESSGTLRPVYSPRDGKNEESHRCFYTKKQRTALYVEADEPTANNNRAKLQYDVESFVVDHSTPNESDEEAECRPCSMKELAEAYCQSDLVVRGTVTAVQSKPELEAAELIFRVTKTLHRIEETETNEVFPILPNSHHEKNIRIRVSSACDARHGHGEFVIMARRRLDDLTLVCAPRLETWAKVVLESKTAPCLLKS